MQIIVDGGKKNLPAHFEFGKIDPAKNKAFQQIFRLHPQITVEDGLGLLTDQLTNRGVREFMPRWKTLWPKRAAAANTFFCATKAQHFLLVPFVFADS